MTDTDVSRALEVMKLARRQADREVETLLQRARDKGLSDQEIAQLSDQFMGGLATRQELVKACDAQVEFAISAIEACVKIANREDSRAQLKQMIDAFNEVHQQAIALAATRSQIRQDAIDAFNETAIAAPSAAINPNTPS